MTLGDLEAAGRLGTAYDPAKDGGRYSGDYVKLTAMGEREIRKSLASQLKQIDRHRRWIDDPFGTGRLPPGYDSALSKDLLDRYWPRNIELINERLSIVLAVMREREIDP